MSDETRPTQGGTESWIETIIADGSELMHLADEFVVSLPMHLRLLQDGLRTASAEHLKQAVIKLRGAPGKGRERVLRAAQAGEVAEECVIAGLAARLDDLTGTIARLSHPLP